MDEGRFKTKLKTEIERRFPGSMVVHLSPSDRQGIPDLLVLFPNGKWAALEGKRDYSTYCKESGKRPNQEYYVEEMNKGGYAAFIYPENKDDILDELEEVANEC